jgi:hypothetical protein
MKIKSLWKTGTVLGCIAAVLVFLMLGGVSWIITCGIVKLITLCFGWTFDWLIATGIWLVMILAKSVFNHTVTVKK